MSMFDGIEKARRGPPATRKQITYVTDLCEEAGAIHLLMDLGENPTAQDVSTLIDRLTSDLEGDNRGRDGWT